MTSMINLKGGAINAKRLEEAFGHLLSGPMVIRTRGGIGFPITPEGFVTMKQQLGPALIFLERHKDEIRKMIAYDGVESAALEFGIRIDLEEIIFNINNSLPLELLRLATELKFGIEISFYFGSKLMSSMPDTKKVQRVECLVTYLAREDGGRAKPLSPGELTARGYRPHLVLDEPQQRKEIVVDGGRTVETYLGVAFCEGPADVKAGESFKAILDLIYYPQNRYERLQPGALFTVREGPQTVAYGTVLTRST